MILIWELNPKAVSPEWCPLALDTQRQEPLGQSEQQGVGQLISTHQRAAKSSNLAGDRVTSLRVTRGHHQQRGKLSTKNGVEKSMILVLRTFWDLPLGGGRAS